MSGHGLSFAPVFSGLQKRASEPFSRLPPLGKTVNGSKQGVGNGPEPFSPPQRHIDTKRNNAMSTAHVKNLHGCTAVQASTQEDSHGR